MTIIPKRLMGTNSPWMLLLQMAPSALGAEAPSSLSEMGEEEGRAKEGQGPLGLPGSSSRSPVREITRSPICLHPLHLLAQQMQKTIKELIIRRLGRGWGPINTPLLHTSTLHVAPTHDPRLLPLLSLFSGPNAPLTHLPHFSAALNLSPPTLCCPHSFLLPSFLSLISSPPPLRFCPFHPSHCLLHPSIAHPSSPLLPLASLHSPPLLFSPHHPSLSNLNLGISKCACLLVHKCGAPHLLQVSRFKVVCQVSASVILKVPPVVLALSQHWALRASWASQDLFLMLIHLWGTLYPC